MSRNPYETDGAAPSLQRSVFVFMDILGYADQIKSAEQAGTQQELLGRLHQALSEARSWLESKYEDIPEMAKLLPKDFYALKAFTDNIVIGWPIRSDAEIETGSAFSKVADFQFVMATKGFFVRGALSIGDAYIDDIVVFGDALTQAYIGESKLARDPRIILMESAVSAVKQHLQYYSSSNWAPQVRVLLRDSDGQWFVNYLDCLLIAEDEAGPFYDELLSHKAAVEEKLNVHKNNPPIFSKYAWVAGYHNYFCDMHPNFFTDEYKINAELFKASPKLITDTD
jgi:hypothetical protein